MIDCLVDFFIVLTRNKAEQEGMNSNV